MIQENVEVLVDIQENAYSYTEALRGTGRYTGKCLWVYRGTVRYRDKQRGTCR